jgi:hypothetical protein
MVLCFGSASEAGPPPPRYFPLDPGNRWTYVEEGGESRVVIAVLGIEGEAYRLATGGSQVMVRGLPDALDIELPGEGFVPWYRFQEDTFVHRSLSGCDDRATLTAVTRSDKVTTPAGTFEGCLRLDYSAGNCSDSGRISEWWKPEVGLVRWTESSFAGEISHALESFERLGPRAPFLRGDADANGAVDITDAVSTLNFLFLGGTRPGCEDAADSNDDGELNISDGIHTLGFLFLGSEPPPFPGPDAAGFDGTPADPFPCGDHVLAPPGPAAASSLPGVSFDLSGNPPAITLAQAARGVAFVYRTRIERDLPGVISMPLDAGRCDGPEPGGLAVLEMIDGGGHSYCLCDTGRCGRGDEARDLAPGVHEGRFEWDGRNWFGPSDFNNPKGEPFPPGTYRFQVRAAGTYRDAGGSEIPWEAEGSVGFHLVP